MNTLPIRICDSSAKAPNYRGGDFKAATLKEAVIVLNGTEGGKSTVDFVFEVKDASGNTTDVAVAMTTGAIVTMLVSAIKGAEER